MVFTCVVLNIRVVVHPIFPHQPLLTVGDLAITSPPPQAQLRLCLPATRSVHLTVPNEYTSHLGVVLCTFIQH